MSLTKALEMVGLSRWDAPEFLKRHGAYLNVTAEDVEEDLKMLRRIMDAEE